MSGWYSRAQNGLVLSIYEGNREERITSQTRNGCRLSIEKSVLVHGKPHLSSSSFFYFL